MLFNGLLPPSSQRTQNQNMGRVSKSDKKEKTSLSNKLRSRAISASHLFIHEKWKLFAESGLTFDLLSSTSTSHQVTRGPKESRLWRMNPETALLKGPWNQLLHLRLRLQLWRVQCTVPVGKLTWPKDPPICIRLDLTTVRDQTGRCCNTPTDLRLLSSPRPRWNRQNLPRPLWRPERSSFSINWWTKLSKSRILALTGKKRLFKGCRSAVATCWRRPSILWTKQTRSSAAPRSTSNVTKSRIWPRTRKRARASGCQKATARRKSTRAFCEKRPP